MKKILLLLLLSYSFSFATTCYEKKRNTYDLNRNVKINLNGIPLLLAYKIQQVLTICIF